MERIQKEQSPEEASAEKRLQELYAKELLAGNVEGITQLENQFGATFKMDGGDLQVFYTKILVEDIPNKAELINFLLSRTNITPAPEIIIAHYKSEDFKLSDEEIEILKVLRSNESLQNAIEQIDLDKAAEITEHNLIRYIKFLGTETSELFPHTYEKAFEQITSKLTENQDIADYFVENLGYYYQEPWVAENVAKAIQEYSVAQKFVYATQSDQTIWKDEPWVSDILTKANEIVAKHKAQFPEEDWQDQDSDSYDYSHGNEGFSETDPFENHPWRFDSRQIHLASAISELMAGALNTKEIEALGINAQEAGPILAKINEQISTAYDKFLEGIRTNKNIKEDDRNALLDPESSEIKMSSLLDNVRSFVARYLVQSMDGDISKFSGLSDLSKDIERILQEGFKRYIKIHEVDVPLYDKLYEEFDNLRETGRYPLEVFLGRDGIYAYIGRRTQDVARRRKLGLEGKKKLKESGEILEIHPKYTVYPRYFRDNINYETKKQFLQQEGISADADPLFYDTGYTGTIPEQIMRVMDFDSEDIERRIRLLSAPSVHRRVKGIPENARSEIIEYIEHNAKLEETAEGLLIEEKTGKIRHVAK
ncbi:MAG: hypothetical protein KKA99_01485, partial [Gammaproteobacteria bacterium]|nr:hypothetical protein [Gammaproteobacteria bacterium]